jgi:AMMECR1 domain-containing protein
LQIMLSKPIKRGFLLPEIAVTHNRLHHEFFEVFFINAGRVLSGGKLLFHIKSIHI